MSTATEIIKVIDGQIVQGEELHIFLAELSKQAKQIPVIVDGLTTTFKDRATCEEGQELVKKAAAAIKSVMLAAEPERLALRGRLEELLSQRDKIIATIQTQVDQLERAGRTFVLAENQATQREQDRLNRNRKPENQIELKPNLPSVPGAPRIIGHYRFKVLDPKKVRRPFWCIDEKTISQKCRDDKNPKKTEAEVGGIKVWIE